MKFQSVIMLITLISLCCCQLNIFGWLVIGDYGYEGLPGQLAVADHMDKETRDH